MISGAISLSEVIEKLDGKGCVDVPVDRKPRWWTCVFAVCWRNWTAKREELRNWEVFATDLALKPLERKRVENLGERRWLWSSMVPGPRPSFLSWTDQPDAACVLFMISSQLSTKHQPKKSQGKMLPTTLSMIVVSIIGFRRKSQLLGPFRMSKVWAWDNNSQPQNMSPQQPKSSFLKCQFPSWQASSCPNEFSRMILDDFFWKMAWSIGFFFRNWVPPQQKSKEWLSELHLSHYTTQLLQWCQANGGSYRWISVPAMIDP